VLVNANSAAGTLPTTEPALQSGAPFDCSTLENSVTSGGEFGGGGGVFDSAIGDLAVQFKFSCE
jgi:hypothetical protein